MNYEEELGSTDSRVERGMTMQVQKPEKRVETVARTPEQKGGA